MKYRHLKGYRYELLEMEVVLTEIKDLEIQHPLISLWKGGRLFVHPHYAWDGASGPFTQQTKTNKRGSLIHDALYQLMREGLLPRKYRKYVDQLFKQICLEDGMSKFRAWYFYKAVRMFSKKSSLPRKKPRGKIVEIPIRIK